MTFNLETFNVAKYDEILSRGLSQGLGSRDGQMCIEAAICTVLDLPHGDDPGCVADSVRTFKISLNDAAWSSPEARSKALRNLGLAQLGSRGVINDVEFTRILAEKTIRVLITRLFRMSNDQEMLKAADRCEAEGTSGAAEAAARAASAASSWAAAQASWAASRAARAASAASRAAQAAASWAARAAAADEFLILAADLALETLRELNSPGVSLL